MALSRFHALCSGRIDGWKYQHQVSDIGMLAVPSGRLEISDPLVALGSGLVVPVPPGSYPVKLTLADVSDEQDGSHLRQTYLSVVLSDGELARVETLAAEDAVPRDDQEYAGVGVDAGTVGFIDAEAARCAAADQRWQDGLLDEFEGARTEQGAANITLPQTCQAENLILSESGWGDGHYPVLGSYDAAGRLLGVHVDLLVDEPESDPEAGSALAASGSAAAPPLARPQTHPFDRLTLRFCAAATAAAGVVRLLALIAGFFAAELGPSNTTVVFNALSALDLATLIVTLAGLAVARETGARLASAFGWLALLTAFLWTSLQAILVIVSVDDNHMPFWLEPAKTSLDVTISIAVVACFATSALLFARQSRR